MTTLLFSLIIIVWISAGVHAYGKTIGYFKYHFPYLPAPVFLAFLVGTLGPLGCIVNDITSLGEKTPWDVNPYTREERWEIFKKTYPILVETNTYDFSNFDK